ncbi:hypothetical protein EYF80_067429 [Liparis tanakae]|uniref:Uncharacterized protein n=1 Tax=Liparis tanakae TaxID=230148 RepID=A0A4Z2E159_9TELE|nr:hypothetical protein EYF80_067429 [Liparis tanakae]
MWSKKSPGPQINSGDVDRGETCRWERERMAGGRLASSSICGRTLKPGDVFVIRAEAKRQEKGNGAT